MEFPTRVNREFFSLNREYNHRNREIWGWNMVIRNPAIPSLLLPLGLQAIRSPRCMSHRLGLAAVTVKAHKGPLEVRNVPLQLELQNGPLWTLIALSAL
jgi:hypothetical protein